MARLNVRLLGGFESRLDTGEALAIPTRKAQALVAILALRPGQWHTRDRLIGLLWAQTGQAQARHSLRQALVRLRRALPAGSAEWLLTRRDELALNPAVADVDAAAFAGLSRPAGRAELERALALYRGDLLEGFSLDEVAFEEWVMAERARLRELALDGFLRLLQQQSDAGASEAAIQTALRLLALDPLQEPVHRRLMSLYARQGRRAAALRQYQLCVAVLQRELGVEPEAATKALYRDLLSDKPRPAPPDTAPAPPPEAGAAPRARLPRALAGAPRPDIPLVGRAAPLRRMRRALDEAWSGAPAGRAARVVALAGQAGIGKTRLIEELSAYAGQRGGRVLVGRAHETEQILPFRPWIDALRAGHALADPAIAGALAGGRRRELARLFPELGEPAAESAASPESRLRLFEALVDLVRRLAARAPLLLVLEDLHWSDDLSLNLVAFMVRQLDGQPALVVVTVREEEIGAPSGLRTVLHELEREGRLVLVEVPPLSQDETGTLVRALGRAGRPEARLTAQVWSLSSGNPFVIVETMRALSEGRAPDAGAALPLPERVRDMVASRIERLDERTRRLLDAAAVINEPFAVPLIRQAAGLGERETAEGIEELVRRRLLDAVDDRFALAHDRIRTVAYDRLFAPTRRALHAAVGAALEALDPGPPHQIADRLAFHYARAEDAPRTIAALILFAEAARRRYAFADAQRALDSALALASALPPPERDRRIVEIAVTRAWVLSYEGRFQDILDLLLPLEATVQGLEEPRLAGPFYFRLGLTHGYVGNSDRGVAEVERATRAAQACGDDVTLGQAQYALALLHFWMGNLRKGLARGHEAIEQLTRARRRDWLGLAHYVVGMTLTLAGDFDAAIRAEERAAAIGREVDDSRLQSLAASALGWIHATRGEWEEGLEACRRSLELARDPVATLAGEIYAGVAHQEMGDADRAVALLDRAMADMVAIGVRRVVDRYTPVLADAHLGLGNVDRARELAGRALEVNRETGSRWGCALARRILARVDVRTGAVERAAEELDAVVGEFAAMGSAFEEARTRLDLAEALAALGRRAEAASHLAEARRRFEVLRVPRFVERADRQAASLAGAGPAG